MIQSKPSVLTISGNDPTGLAGLQADARALQSMDCHVASVMTATTAQSNQQFFAMHEVSADVVNSQLDALVAEGGDKFPVIKIGLLASAEQVHAVFNHALLNNAGSYLRHELIQGKQIVLDPVLKTSSGSEIAKQDLIEAIKLYCSKITCLTPNIDEAELLTGIKIQTPEDVEQAAKELLALGCQSVLIKGGHASYSTDQVKDFYLDQQGDYYWAASDKQSGGFNRGTGCAMASLIAGALAQKSLLPDAPVIAKMQITEGFKQRYKLSDYSDEQSGTLSFPSWKLVKEQANTGYWSLPETSASFITKKYSFPSCQENEVHSEKLGLYPVVDRANWLERLLPLGISTIQLRVKDLKDEALEAEIQRAIEISEKYGARLFINDYWQLAIKYNAYGVHLGQEDVHLADLELIDKAGLRLGLSNHCYYEVAQALTIRPSYMAFGPVYATKTKDMPWIPGEVGGIRHWRKLIRDLPLVAIGGIHGDRFDKVKCVGVDSIAMITAITDPQPVENSTMTPEQAAEFYLSKME